MERDLFEPFLPVNPLGADGDHGHLTFQAVTRHSYEAIPGPGMMRACDDMVARRSPRQQAVIQGH